MMPPIFAIEIEHPPALLCVEYIVRVNSYTQREKVANKFTMSFVT